MGCGADDDKGFRGILLSFGINPSNLKLVCRNYAGKWEGLGGFFQEFSFRPVWSGRDQGVVKLLDQAVAMSALRIKA